MAPVRPIQFDPDNPLAPVRGETASASAALMDYATMGVARSLRKLLAIYQKLDLDYTDYKSDPAGWKRAHPGAHVPKMAPTDKWATLADWSRRWAWVDRVREFDKAQLLVDKMEFEQDRRAWKMRRVDSLKVAFNNLLGAVAEAEKKGVPLDRIARALVKVNADMRIEFGEGDGEVGTPRGVKMVVVNLPAGQSVTLDPAAPDPDEDDEEEGEE
jgi:hypothetical protein